MAVIWLPPPLEAELGVQEAERKFNLSHGTLLGELYRSPPGHLFDSFGSARGLRATQTFGVDQFAPRYPQGQYSAYSEPWPGGVDLGIPRSPMSTGVTAYSLAERQLLSISLR